MAELGYYFPCCFSTIIMNIFLLIPFCIMYPSVFSRHISKRDIFPLPTVSYRQCQVHFQRSHIFYLPKQWDDFFLGRQEHRGKFKKNGLPVLMDQNSSLVLTYMFLITRHVNIFIMFLSFEVLLCGLVNTITYFYRVQICTDRSLLICLD